MIWIRPQQTVAFMAKNASTEWLWVLIAAGGISRVLERIALVPGLLKLDIGMLTAFVIVSGLIAGLFVVFVVARVVYWVLRRLGGVGSWVSTRTAVAWALAPGLPSAALWGIMLASYGISALTPASAPQSDDVHSLILTVDYAVLFCLTLWSLLLEIICLADVHKLPVWKVVLTEVLMGVALGALGLIGFLLP
jgi:hypothetical protein